MLVLTLVIASLTLIERRILALIQRRVGPQFVGYKGRLQYIADALKLLSKGTLIPETVNKFWFIFIPAVLVAVCYALWMNVIWGPNTAIFDIEFNLVYSSLLSFVFSVGIIITGYFSRNKYAMLGAIRCSLLTLNLELSFGLMILIVSMLTNSFSFSFIVTLQEIWWFAIFCFNILGLIFIIFLLETNRAPFDLAEAESELVAGYVVEYGGFHFGIYYLGEYLHLFFFSITIILLFFGGWELPRFLLYPYYSLYTFNYFLC